MGSVNCCNKPTEIQDLEPKDTTKEINQTDKDLEPQDNSKIEPIDNQRGSGSIHEIYSGDGDKEVQIDIPNDKESEPQKNDDNKECQNEEKKDEEPQNEQEQNEQAENEQEQNEQEQNEQEQNEQEQNQPEEKQPEEEQPEQVQQDQEAEQPEEKQSEKEQQEQEQPKEKDEQKEEKKEEEENIPHEKHVEENKNEDIEIKEVELKKEELKNPVILQQNGDDEVKYTNQGDYTPDQNIIVNEIIHDKISTNPPNEQTYQYGQEGNFVSIDNNFNNNEQIGQMDCTKFPDTLHIENLQSCEPAADAILANFSNDEYNQIMKNITDKSYQTVYNVGEGSTYPAPLVNGGQNIDINNTGNFNEFNLLNYNNYQYEKPQEFNGGYVQQFKSVYNVPKKITSNQNFNFGDLGFAEVKPSITSVSYMKPKVTNFNLNYSFGNNVEFSEYNTSNNYFKNEVVDPMNSIVYNKSYIDQP